jgi:hypothetical protein
VLSVREWHFEANFGVHSPRMQKRKNQNSKKEKKKFQQQTPKKMIE